MILSLSGHQVENIAFFVSDSVEGLDDPNAVFHFRRGRPKLRPEIFRCQQSVRGRYVRVTMAKNDSSTSSALCFNEVEVYGQLPYTGPQTTTVSSGLPDRRCTVSQDTSSLGTDLVARGSTYTQFLFFLDNFDCCLCNPLTQSTVRDSM